MVWVVASEQTSMHTWSSLQGTAPNTTNRPQQGLAGTSSTAKYGKLCRLTFSSALGSSASCHPGAGSVAPVTGSTHCWQAPGCSCSATRYLPGCSCTAGSSARPSVPPAASATSLYAAPQVTSFAPAVSNSCRLYAKGTFVALLAVPLLSELLLPVVAALRPLLVPVSPGWAAAVVPAAAAAACAALLSPPSPRSCDSTAICTAAVGLSTYLHKKAWLQGQQCLVHA